MEFSPSVYKALSAICLASGQVFLGGFVAGINVLPLDSTKIAMLILDLAWSLTLWFWSVLFSERGKL